MFTYHTLQRFDLLEMRRQNKAVKIFGTFELQAMQEIGLSQIILARVETWRPDLLFKLQALVLCLGQYKDCSVGDWKLLLCEIYVVGLWFWSIRELAVAGMVLGKVGWGSLGLGRWCWFGFGFGLGGGLGLAHLWEAALPPSLGWLAASPGYSQEEWPPSEARTQAQLARHTSRTTPTPPPCHPWPALLGQTVAEGRQGGVRQGPWWGWYEKGAGEMSKARMAKVKLSVAVRPVAQLTRCCCCQCPINATNKQGREAR